MMFFSYNKNHKIKQLRDYFITFVTFAHLAEGQYKQTDFSQMNNSNDKNT